MPAVGHLHRMRQHPADGLAVAAATVARHDFDAGMFEKPRFDRRRLAVWQKVDDLPSLKIADDGSVAVTLLPGPVVDPDDAQWRGLTCRDAAPYAAQQGVLAHRQQKSARQRLCRPPSKSEAKTTDQTLQACHAPPVALRDPAARLFREYLYPTAANRTAEAPDQQFDANASTMRGQIGESASIAAVNVPRH